MSHDEKRTNDYPNCFYICRYCNLDRNASPAMAPEDGSQLLNPCHDIWAEHFALEGDTLKPGADDGDASYTHAVYDLDDPRKVEMRRFRRETIRACMSLIERGQAVLDRLLERALQKRDPELIDEVQLIEDALRRAWQELERFQLVPQDARSTCPCDGDGLYEVPQALQEQAIEIHPH